jgi:hypothetical protein
MIDQKYYHLLYSNKNDTNYLAGDTRIEEPGTTTAI